MKEEEKCEHKWSNPVVVEQRYSNPDFSPTLIAVISCEKCGKINQTKLDK